MDKEELGNFKYKGKCPASIASLIKLQNLAENQQIARLTDLEIEFKDNAYQVTGIAVPRDGQSQPFFKVEKNADEKSPDQNLFYKLLKFQKSGDFGDCKQNNRKMVQLKEGIPDETFIEQILLKLNLNGYHQVTVAPQQSRRTLLILQDVQLKIALDFTQRSCKVEARQSVGHLKTVSDIVRQTLNLI